MKVQSFPRGGACRTGEVRPLPPGGRHPRIPLWLKLAYTLWLGVWLVLARRGHEPVELLWFCHIGNLVVAAALWAESSLLFSWQAVSLLLVQLLFALDVLAWLTLGWHPVGGTEYLFDPAYPALHRALAWFHVTMPALLLWGLWRLGYDRRGFFCQLAECWVLLPAGYFLGGPELNLNWVYGPWDRPQQVLPPAAYLFVCMAAYPLLLYLPTHLALACLVPRGPRRGGSPQEARVSAACPPHSR
jgi:hypothetical protein